MEFKVRFEIDKSCEEEIIIRCKEINDDVLKLQSLINGIGKSREMELHLNGNDYFIAIDEILFFETDGNKTAAHTADKMYYTDMKLYELEERLPRSFMRVSKSCVVNLKAVASLKREITGICEASFPKTSKKIFISRSYYKPFREKITEIRKV